MLGIAALPLVTRANNPTALDQINPERAWDLQAMPLPDLNSMQSREIFFASAANGELIGPLSKVAVFERKPEDWPDSYGEAIRNNIPPPPGAFVGMPRPDRVLYINQAGTYLLNDSRSSWDWSDPTIKYASNFIGKPDQMRTLRPSENPKVKPEWWPKSGDVAKHHTHGYFVPGRPAFYRVVSCKYLWDSNPGMIGGFGPGNTVSVFTGPHELILEDFSTTPSRRVGFRLQGRNSKSIGNMYVSHDGMVGYIPDNTSNYVWLIPLYKAWENLDSTSPP